MNNLTKAMKMDHKMSVETVMNWIVAEVDASFVDEITFVDEEIPLLIRISLFKRSLLMCFFIQYNYEILQCFGELLVK